MGNETKRLKSFKDFISMLFLGCIFSFLAFISIARYHFGGNWVWIVIFSIVFLLLENFSQITPNFGSKTGLSFNDVAFVWALFILDPMEIALVAIIAMIITDTFYKTALKYRYLDIVTPAVAAWTAAFVVRSPLQNTTPTIVVLCILGTIVYLLVETFQLAIIINFKEALQSFMYKGDYLVKAIALVYGIPAGLLSKDSPWATPFLAAAFALTLFIYKKFENLTKEKENLNTLADTLDFSIDNLSMKEIDKKLLDMAKRLINDDSLVVLKEKPKNIVLAVQLQSIDGNEKWLVIESDDANKRHWRHKDYMRNLEICAAISKRAFESYILRERLTDAAEHDALTGLLSRGSFEKLLELYMEEYRKQNLNVTLLFLDLDNFKPVNDKFGHTVGDKVLKETATRIAKSVRSNDTLARVGGDEFVIICRNATFEDTLILAERIERSVIQPLKIEGREIVIGVSVGIAQASSINNTAVKLINSADKSMYSKKHNSKNSRYAELDVDERSA